MNQDYCQKHWRILKLKYIASLKSGENITSNEISDSEEYPVFGGNGVRGYTSSYTHEGDFPLIGRQGALCGNINYASGKFWASEHAVVVNIFPGYIVRWLGEVLRSMNLNQYSQSAAQPGISVDVIQNLSIPIPPEHEQRLIADYLDRETARIDALVAEKEKMLVLLEEKRAALISRAVTRGLDPNAPLKPSGLDWLGDIPAHWETSRIRFIATFIGGSTPATKEETFWKGGNIPWVSPKDMKTRVITDAEDHLTKEGLKNCASGLLAPDHVLIVVRSGILRHTLPVAINAVPIAINQDIRAFVLNDRVLPEYLAWFIEGKQEPLIEQLCKAVTTVESVEMEYLLNTSIPIPCIGEQLEISNEINKQIEHLDKLKTNINNSIELLKERRAALITAAVTGKIPIEEMTR